MPKADQNRYTVQLLKHAGIVLARLPQAAVRPLAAAIDGLASKPRPADSHRLAGRYEHLRVVVDDWQIVYTVDDDILLIVVVEIAPWRGGR
ncbi:MAG: hypothetical protein U0X20_30565 [Caldilineaceae bacterium]